MSLEDEIIKAIRAHGEWKMRLKMAINSGKSDFQVAVVQKDDQCPFGKWLHSAKADVQGSADYKKVSQLHAQFHREAANVLALALRGAKAEAEKGMAAGGAFAHQSSELTAALMAWSSAIRHSHA